MFKLVRCVAALGLAVSSAAMLAHAQTARYPIRTIEITVSYGAGGSTDLVARAIAQKLQERLGQPAVVRNLPGASGTIGAAAAARANPDGHALYVGFTTETVVVPQVSEILARRFRADRRDRDRAGGADRVEEYPRE